MKIATLLLCLIVAPSLVFAQTTVSGLSDNGGLSATGPVLIGSSAIQTSCDNTGATDATTCLNNAVTAAQNVPGGGVLVVPPGTYKVTGTVAITAPVTVYAYGATIKWGGSAPAVCCTPIMKIGNPAATTFPQVVGMTLKGLTVDGDYTSNLYGMMWDTVRQGSFDDLTVNNIAGTVAGASGPFAYYQTATGSHAFNTSVNVFKNLHALNVWQGLGLAGPASETGSTDNAFVGLHFFNVTATGIDLISNSDTNYFYEAEVFSNISVGSFIGVKFNDGPNPTTQDNDIHEEQFDGLTVVGGNPGSATTGIQINYAYNLRINGYRVSTAGATLTPYAVSGPAYAVSYYIQNLTAPLVTQHGTPAPTVTAGANAGTSPPAPQISGSTISGIITFGTGGSPGGGSLVNVTFPTPLAVPPKSVMLTANNGLTWALQPVSTVLTSAGFTIYAINAPAASRSNTTYSVSYLVTP